MVGDIQSPMLYIVGDAQQTALYDHSKKLHDLSTKARFKELYVVAGAIATANLWDHSRKSYVTRLDKFIRRCIHEYDKGAYDEWEQGDGLHTSAEESYL